MSVTFLVSSWSISFEILVYLADKDVKNCRENNTSSRSGPALPPVFEIQEWINDLSSSFDVNELSYSLNKANPEVCLPKGFFRHTIGAHYIEDAGDAWKDM